MKTIDRMHWRAWSDDNKVPFYINDMPSEMRRDGLGNGEQKLVNEKSSSLFMGEIQGGRTSFDVIDLFGRKCEIKQPTKDGTIVINVEAFGPFGRFKRKLDEALTSVRDFFDSVDDVTNELTTIMYTFADLQEKVDKLSLAKGVIEGGTYENPVGLLQIFKALRDVVKKHSDTNDNLDLRSFFEGVKVGINISKSRLMCILKKEGIITSDNFDTSTAIGFLSHEYFSNPDKFVEDWKTFARPSELLGDVDIIVFVDKDRGFFETTKDYVDENFEIYCISKRGLTLKMKKRE